MQEVAEWFAPRRAREVGHTDRIGLGILAGSQRSSPRGLIMSSRSVAASSPSGIKRRPRSPLPSAANRPSSAQTVLGVIYHTGGRCVLPFCTSLPSPRHQRTSAHDKVFQTAAGSSPASWSTHPIRGACAWHRVSMRGWKTTGRPSTWSGEGAVEVRTATSAAPPESSGQRADPLQRAAVSSPLGRPRPTSDPRPLIAW